MKKSVLFILTAFVISMAACKPSVTPEKLYGKWKYIKVENPNANPPDSVRRTELEEQAPYIQFSKNNDVMIVWGGKTLSHGKYRTEGSNIRFKEVLADGKTREFPFYVSKLTDKVITFETMGEDGSRVTAVRE